MKNGLLERIKTGEVLLADGALGTMLIDRGLVLGECPEHLNLTRPEMISDIARLYVDAGSDFLSTNTFGATPLQLSKYSLSGKAKEINVAAVRILREVVGEKRLIIASCGPTGKLLKPYGDTDSATVFQTYQTQLGFLAEAGVDGFLFETFTDLNEAVLAIKAAKDIAPALPVIATMTFDKITRGFFTIMGCSIEKAAVGLKDAGADVIGSNCGNGIDNMIEIAKGFQQCSDLPLIIQSNAGLPEMKSDKPTYKETPEFMAEKARVLLEMGIGILGGCCGTTPHHISAFRKLIHSTKKQPEPAAP